jgi:molybdopterin molybdotransferase
MTLFKEANEIVHNSLSHIKKSCETIHILDSVNRVLGEDIKADIDMPAFDNSAMDGYAVKNIDNKDGWDIIGEISAGSGSKLVITENECVLIMTGARIPDGCTAVVPVEDVITKDNKVFLKENAVLKTGAHIRKKGSDVQKGDVVLKKGTYITPKESAVLAAFGRNKLLAEKKTKIGLIQTGSELIDINDIPRDDKIRNSNYYAMLNAIADINASAVPLGIVEDDKKKLITKIKNALEYDIDILITLGGVSVGKYDLVKEAYTECGIDIKFSKVNIKPGKPFTFGEYKTGMKTIPVFGLPGNPVSCLVNFILFIKQNIDRIHSINRSPYINAVCENDIYKKDNKRHFVMAILRYDENENAFVTSNRSQSSGDLTALGNSNCLLVIDDEVHCIKKGDTVRCIMI